MKRPTFFPGIQATCEDCQRFPLSAKKFFCTHKNRAAGPFDTICECYIDRKTGESIN